MSYLERARDPEQVRELLARIRSTATRPWTLMEVCGGQTHAIAKHGLAELLPESIELLHGPGCPVCVTPLETIDRAHALARLPDVVLCSFGDMLRVPGSSGDLSSCRAAGADVRVVYSPLDALALAKKLPDRQIVFLAVGFETTAPANAMAVRAAAAQGVKNFSVLSSHVLVPPALEAILGAEGCRVQAFLGPGHVCTIMGTAEYEDVARRHSIPIAIAGFEPVDLLSGVLAVVQRLEAGEPGVSISYAHAVRPEGNSAARATVDEVFEVTDQVWRGIGTIPKSGLSLRDRWAELDAMKRFDVRVAEVRESPLCIAGEVLRGVKRPTECPAFGKACTPETPLGATMVSSEGACAAYFRFKPAGRA